MFGSFSEESLLAYTEQIAEKYKEKANGGQGREFLDNLGVGDNDKSFIEEYESTDSDDYKGATGKAKKALKARGVIPKAQPRTTNTHGHTANLFSHCEGTEWESYDFAQCLRDDGSVYGTRGKCRKGKAISASAVARLKEERKTPEQKKREGIRKRGEKAVTRAKAEQILAELVKEGATGKKAAERRSKQGKGDDREEQVRQVRAKAFLTMDRLRQKAKKMVPGQKKQQVEARIARLDQLLGRLDKAQQKARDAKPKMKDGMGTLPDWAATGKQLLG